MKRFVIGLTVLLAIAGCGQQSSVPSTTNAAPLDQKAQPPAKKDRYQIGVVPKGLSHQFWLTVKAGAETAGREFNADVIWQGPAKETEVEKQISIIEDMISGKKDAIVMAACDENALIGTIQKTINAGIPVVTIDSGVKSDLPATFIATDNIAGAKAAANELARLIGNEGEVGLIPFVAGAATSEMREAGFKEGLKAFPNVKLVSTLYSQSDAGKAMSVTQDMMTTHPSLKGIFVASEPGAVGTAQAIKAAGKAGQIKLVAFDASEEEIAALKDGTIQALVVQNPFQMGYKGVKAAVDTLKGIPVEKRIDTGVTVVTMENFNQPDIQKILYPLAK
jgi:ribose transport system substrate-binding protein